MTAKTTAPIADLAAATPVEIDTAAAELDHEFYWLNGRLRSALDMLHGIDGQRAAYRGRSSAKTWPKADEETIKDVRAKLLAGGLDVLRTEDAQHYLAQYDEQVAAIAANRTEADRLDAEYERRPWQRYITVAGGHIHAGYWCAGGTIRPTTIRQWTPSLAGKPAADAVAELGTRLCTHCFPEAPVEWQAATENPDHCPGSRQAEVPGTYRRQGMSGYGRCRECGTNQTVTGRGLVRAHKAPKQA
jgi:hypothetical protein